MAITKIRQVPSDLPHAHLYLDDVEEICQVLIETYKKNPYPWAEEPTIVFSTRDSQMESIEDLEKLGGSAKNFAITVTGGDSNWGSVQFHSFVNPDLRNYCGSDEERWAVYSKIKTIFEHRQYRAKNALFALPSWMRWSVWFIIMVFPSIFLPRIIPRNPITDL